MATPTQGLGGGGNAKMIWGVILALFALGGVVGFVSLRGTPEPLAQPQPSAPEVVASPAPAAPAAAEIVTEDADTAQVDPAAQTEPQSQTDTVAADPAPAPPPGPSFDLVRVDSEGAAVIAGQAPPGANVTLRLDDVDVADSTADGAGNFVAMFQIAPSDRPRVLSLEAVVDGGVPIAGLETAMIAPFAGPTPEVAQVVEPQADPAGADAAQSQDSTQAVVTAEAGADETQAADAAAANVVADAAPAIASADAAPAIVVAGAEGLRVVQGADAGSTDALGQTALQLDAISYDEGGAVTLAGRGPEAATLRVSLDGQIVQTGETDPAGQFSLDLSDVAPGTYALVLEQVDATGAVLGVLETPFRREDPARIRANPMMVDPGSSVITVQRGFTLWGIAEANFGSGFLYVQIFQENKDAIRDPDLIYPGQIFALPDLPRADTAP